MQSVARGIGILSFWIESGVVRLLLPLRWWRCGAELEVAVTTWCRRGSGWLAVCGVLNTEKRKLNNARSASWA
ncbi:hypothetical protein RchiOBHm_Chr2g0097221 [Rosa chinensis]|uniref:Uncharacterized protein n=1 Tax=Rosa chinensis TaxID=74649 RepID=A0A2P6RL92_ROSCH|nr:hypothetical protein RchiOBHm_Chr2g0097221 [Rosa chinensis]